MKGKCIPFGGMVNRYLLKYNQIKMLKARLKILTPVHIGSGQTMNKNIDFAYENGQIGFFDLNKIVELIGIENINQLTATIEQNKSTIEFLRQGRGIENVMEDFCYRVCKTRNISQNTSQLKEHVSSSLKGVYIPGSSLKGSIKTAVWNEVLTDEILKDFNVSNLKNRRGKWSDANMDEQLFGQRQNDKTTRFLKVGDIYFENPKTEVFETIIINQHNRRWDIKRGSGFLVECIPPGAEADFDLKLDINMLRENQSIYPDKFGNKNTEFLESIQSLCKMINDFTMDILDWEIDQLEDEYFDELQEGVEFLNQYDKLYKQVESLKENEFIIRLGGNVGWRFTTGGWVSKKSLNIDDRNYENLRRTIQKKSYPMDKILLPKTRKATSQGIPFGFVKVTIDK